MLFLYDRLFSVIQGQTSTSNSRCKLWHDITYIKQMKMSQWKLSTEIVKVFSQSSFADIALSLENGNCFLGEKNNGDANFIFIPLRKSGSEFIVPGVCDMGENQVPLLQMCKNITPIIRVSSTISINQSCHFKHTSRRESEREQD